MCSYVFVCVCVCVCVCVRACMRVCVCVCWGWAIVDMIVIHYHDKIIKIVSYTIVTVASGADI